MKILSSRCLSAAFNFTVHGAVPDSETFSVVLRSNLRIPSAATLHAEKSKASDSLRREKGVMPALKTAMGITWKREYQFRCFGMNIYGALGPEAKKAIKQFSKIRVCIFDQPPDPCRRKILQSVNVALLRANAKMLSLLRPQL